MLRSRPILRSAPAVLSAAALLAGCTTASSGPADPPTADTGWLVSEGRDGTLERQRVPLHGPVQELGQEFQVITVEAGKGVFSHGPAKGLSGSPVLDETGRTIGALARSYSGERGGSALVLGQETFDETFRAAAADDGARLTRADRLPRADDVVPGSSIETASIWGDLVVASNGVVAARQGADVMVYAHLIRGQGRCTYALLRAPVLGTVRGRGEAYKITGTGELLGTIWFDGFHGCVGTLGAAPPSLRVRVRMAEAHPPVDWSFHVARDPRRAASLLGILAGHVADQLGPQTAGGEWIVLHDTGDASRTERIEFDGGAAALRTTLPSTWKTLAIEGGVFAIDSLGVEIVRRAGGSGDSR